MRCCSACRARVEPAETTEVHKLFADRHPRIEATLLRHVAEAHPLCQPNRRLARAPHRCRTQRDRTRHASRSSYLRRSAQESRASRRARPRTSRRRAPHRPEPLADMSNSSRRPTGDPSPRCPRVGGSGPSARHARSQEPSSRALLRRRPSFIPSATPVFRVDGRCRIRVRPDTLGPQSTGSSNGASVRSCGSAALRSVRRVRSLTLYEPRAAAPRAGQGVTPRLCPSPPPPRAGRHRPLTSGHSRFRAF